MVLVALSSRLLKELKSIKLGEKTMKDTEHKVCLQNTSSAD